MKPNTIELCILPKYVLKEWNKRILLFSIFTFFFILFLYFPFCDNRRNACHVPNSNACFHTNSQRQINGTIAVAQKLVQSIGSDSYGNFSDNCHCYDKIDSIFVVIVALYGFWVAKIDMFIGFPSCFDLFCIFFFYCSSLKRRRFTVLRLLDFVWIRN